MAKRVIVPAILIAVLLLGGYGCMKSERRMDINEMALSHMEQKYGEKFEHAAQYGNSMTGTREFLATCKSLPGQHVLVQIENYTGDDRIFRDNYIAVKYLQDTIDFLHDCAVKVFGEANVYYVVNIDGLSPELSATAAFDEYLADDRVPLVILIEAKESSYSGEGQFNEIAEHISSKVSKFLLTMVIVDDASYGSYDRDSLYQQVSLRRFVHCARINKLDNGIQVEWLAKE